MESWWISPVSSGMNGMTESFDLFFKLASSNYSVYYIAK